MIRLRAIARLAFLCFVVLSCRQQQVAHGRAVAPPPPPAPAPVAVEAPPAEPSDAVPTLVEAGATTLDARTTALASELSKMWTRNPEQLVTVIDNASRRATLSPSVTLLLAIAHAETNGKILDVSEAGAVGLAQATPIACRQEQYDGKLYVTGDYLKGARAYIMKKPLGDADTIASILVDRDTAKTRRRARRLLNSAVELRLEGVEELDLLAPYASDHYARDIAAAKRHNLRALQRLDKLIANGSRAELRRFRDEVRREYRDLKSVQMDSWARYQLDLMQKRDALLEKHFGQPSAYVRRTEPYEAGELLGRELDERFSATSMAEFLVRHLERKADEARALARSETQVEIMTAALYNGGSHNVKRMLVGLISSLPETQRYMRKVPATRRRLDQSIASLQHPVEITRRDRTR
ncbi:MAG: hypothetical protein ACXW2Q_11040 [Thermoanaerobaculia bacterium]